MEKLLKLISSIPEDKVLHAYIGMTIYCIGAILFGPMAAIMLVVTIAVSKELYDSLHDDKHTVDLFDAIATVVGAIPVMALDMIRMW